MADSADRAKLSIHAAHLLRDRYARVAERVGRKGRPRARFLAEQRSRIASTLVLALAAIAALSGATAALTLISEPGDLRAAAIAQACVAILIGGAALAVPVARRNARALYGLTAGSLVAVELGWGLIARLSGGAHSPWLLVVPAGILVGVGLVPLPPRIALTLSVAGYLALLVADPLSPVRVHLFVLMVAAGAYSTARTRHRRALASFLRVERLAANVARLKRMQDQLVLAEKLEALRVLVGGIAHELNNALAVAVASTQQATKLAQGADGTVAALKRAEGGLGRIRATVERLRRFAMASEGVLESADVAAMLDFALESAIGRARSGVAVEREYDPQVGAVQCHVAALAEALYQVARNAVEAMPAGGRLRATVTNEGDKVALTVSDEGKGIAPDALKRIFDPYWRHTIAGNRSGMGLSAVYGIVTALGGSLRVQSGEGKGTTVSVLLPRRNAPSLPPPVLP
jgi:signal transduction histidine kinase